MQHLFRRSVWSLCIALMTLSASNAQLAYKSLAPDFTATDLNGNSHHLYDILDEGKIVILDIFATWCGPCWSYHQQHVLKDLYEKHGPDGNNTLMVLTIEGDSRTNVKCIYGPTDCNYSTIGDWTEGIPYPIIDSRQIAEDYNISYYPTIYMVYPNKLVKEIGQLPLGAIEAEMAKAPKLTQGIDARVLYSKNENGGVCYDIWPSKPHFLIANSGTEVITAMDIEVTNNGKIIYQESWTGEAKPYAIIKNLELSREFLEVNTIYELNMTKINGEDGHDVTYQSHITFDADNLITVSAITDEKSESDKTRYRILDKGGNKVAEGSLSENNAVIDRQHVLPGQGCFTFELLDGGADGIDGSVIVRDSRGNVLYVSSAFSEIQQQEFNVMTVSSETNIDLDEVITSIHPNPVNQTFQVSGLAPDAQPYYITDMTGRIVVRGQYEGQINTNLLPKGSYVLHIEAAGHLKALHFIRH